MSKQVADDLAMVLMLMEMHLGGSPINKDLLFWAAFSLVQKARYEVLGHKIDIHEDAASTIALVHSHIAIADAKYSAKEE